jgi:TonB-linked SusC/RagA family outer membrane protein
MRKFALLLTCLLLFGVHVVFAQSRTITGKVTDSDDGNSLPGVSVVVKGTSIGTVTDIDGKFSLNITKDSKTLRFTFIGYEAKEIEIGSTSSVSVSLSKTTFSVDEVVVTAMGIKKEAKALGYAVQELKSDNLNKAGDPNLSTALQGKIAGVDIKVSSGMPGASSQFVIRGARSFTGDNTPLYVIDGMPVESTAPYSTGDGVTGSDIANRGIDINPNDIESLNVLKGQAAAALYGTRASNGVVIITTKSGKGGPKDKTVVTLSQNTSFDVVSRKPDFQTTYAQGTAGNFVSKTSLAWGPKIKNLANDAGYGGSVDNKYTAAYGKHDGKYYVPQLAQAGLDPWATPTTYDNWNDYFKTGVTSTTAINISKASDEGSYSVGLGYNNQDGIALKTGMQRWNAKATAERKLNKNFTTGFSTNFSNLGLDKLSVANESALQGVYMAPPNYNMKGIPTHLPGDPYTQIYYRSLTFNNPYWVADNNSFTEKTNRFFGNTFMEFKADLNSTMKLTLKYQLGLDNFTSHYQDIFGYGSIGSAGKIDNYGATVTAVNSLATAAYDWKIIEDLDFNLLIGNEFNNSNSISYDEFGQNFNYGGYNNIQNVGTTDASRSISKSRTVGVFYNLSLDYKSMIFFNTTGRNDIVSTMPHGNRTFFYPSVSLGFVVSELAALKESDWLSFAKVRGSYAEVGAPGTYYENYYVKPTYSGSWWSGNPIQYPLGGVSAYIPNNVQYDPNLKPQNTKSYEVGVELKLFKNRVGIDYTYSNQNVEDQIFTVPLAASTGVSYLVMNAGNMQTTSHEIMLNLVPIQTKKFTWDISVNYSKLHNECIKLAEGVESIFLGGFTTPQLRAAAGYTYPVIYGSTFARDSKGRILVNEDPTDADYGMPLSGADGVMASVSPDFILGGSTNFTFKNVTLGAVVEWKSGGHMYNATNGMMDYYGVSKVTEDRESTFIIKGYKADGTPNDIVRGGPNDKGAYQELYCNVLGNIDEAYVYGNSFVKLRELSLKFAFPKKLLPKVNLSISAFARNLLLWTELDNVDPECSLGNDNMQGGFERFSLPQTSSYGFGIELKF